jgi:predicted N-acetyltransferase YhbS
MGKNFPKIISLKDNSSYLEKTIQLIEKSFHYSPNHSFAIDFAPLMSEENHHNCFIMVDENQNVLAHVGAKDKQIEINNKKFNITMLGGIAVDEKYRGQGMFHELFQDVLAEKKSDSSFFLLWSDQEKLYSKYGFILCGHQFENISQSYSDQFTQTTLAQLSEVEFQEIIDLYEKSFKKIHLTVDRSQHDWEILKKITSSDLYIKKSDNKITDYFFKGKGQDLGGIIFEYGSTSDIKNLINLGADGSKIWTGFKLVENSIEQFQFMLAPGDLKKFSDFIHEYSGNKINVRQINQMKQEIYFDFNNETLALNLDEFMHGVFGPQSFEEIDEIKPIFISGLDSI